jgi:hypothetical protein
MPPHAAAGATATAEHAAHAAAAAETAATALAIASTVTVAAALLTTAAAFGGRRRGSGLERDREVAQAQHRRQAKHRQSRG